MRGEASRAELGFTKMKTSFAELGSVWKLIQIGLEIGLRLRVVSRLLCRDTHFILQGGPERRALRQFLGLDEQGISSRGIGGSDRIGGFEKPLGKLTVNPGQPVLTIRDEKRFGLGPGECFRLGRMTRSQLNGGKFGPQLMNPCSRRIGLDCIGQFRSGFVILPVQPPRDPPDQSGVRGFLLCDLLPCRERIQCLDRVGVSSLLQCPNDLRRQWWSDRFERPWPKRSAEISPPPRP